MKSPLKNWLAGILVLMGIVNFVAYFHYQRYIAGSLFFALTLLLAASITFGYSSDSVVSKTRRIVSNLCSIIGILIAVLLFIYAAKI